MSKILVIQPHRMLQQAIALSLFPAHEVQMTEAIPDSLPADDFDVVIVDAASLKETTGLAGQNIRAVHSWKLPVIWIESGESSETPEFDKFVRIKMPITREALESSVATCVRGSTASRRNGATTMQHLGMAEAEKQDTASGSAENSEVIELVDIVDDDPSQKTPKTGSNKKR